MSDKRLNGIEQKNNKVPGLCYVETRGVNINRIVTINRLYSRQFDVSIRPQEHRL